MNSETKIILDELTKKFDEFKSEWRSSLSESETKLGVRLSKTEQKLETLISESESKLEKRYEEKEEQLENLMTLADDRWERRFADLHISQDARVSALERVTGDFDAWRPDVENSLGYIRLEVNKISKH
ncbi:unnamed protein product [Urochloa humidicola]